MKVTARPSVSAIYSLIDMVKKNIIFKTQKIQITIYFHFQGTILSYFKCKTDFHLVVLTVST